jgi:hypothetical protein
LILLLDRMRDVIQKDFRLRQVCFSLKLENVLLTGEQLGWDAVTGLGSMNFANLRQALA